MLKIREFQQIFGFRGWILKNSLLLKFLIAFLILDSRITILASSSPRAAVKLAVALLILASRLVTVAVRLASSFSMVVSSFNTDDVQEFESGS